MCFSSVTVEGSFEPFYFNDGSNTADVSSLTVTAKDEDGNDFDVTGKVKWYAEANDDITVDETTGSIEFTAPGTYHGLCRSERHGIQPCYRCRFCPNGSSIRLTVNRHDSQSHL